MKEIITKFTGMTVLLLVMIIGLPSIILGFIFNLVFFTGFRNGFEWFDEFVNNIYKKL